MATKKAMKTNFFPPLSFVEVFGSRIRDKHPGSATLLRINARGEERDRGLSKEKEVAGAGVQEHAEKHCRGPPTVEVHTLLWRVLYKKKSTSGM